MSDNRTPALISLGEFGERARPMRGELHEAALIIGLGQVGLQAVARVHDMLAATLTRRDIQTNVRLLAIARRRSIREEAILPREEKLLLTYDPVSWGDVPGRYAYLGVAQWWPHSPRAREMLDDPWQVRATSRLMLYDNAALLSEALYKLTGWLHEVGTGRDIKLTRHIYVLGSLAEAEGSGMVFDIVTRLRALCRQEATSIIGVFAMRALSNAADPEKIGEMANAYATLREIDAYTLRPDLYPSTLPVIGHTLSKSEPRRALDMIFLSDDAAQPSVEPPETALAELVTTWITASLLPTENAPPLPAPISTEKDRDRFSGYTTFGVAKLALPTRTAMELAAVGVAQSALNTLKSTHANTPTSVWAAQTANALRGLLFGSDILRIPNVGNRMREWTYELSAAGLIRKLDTRSAKGEVARMVDLVGSEWRRLERESAGVTSEPGTTSAVPDTLRARIDAALKVEMDEACSGLATAPVDMAYAKGLGLVWTLSALDDLDAMLRSGMGEFEHNLAEAQAAQQVTRQALLDSSSQYDMKAGARFANARKQVVAELDDRAQNALNAVAEVILAQARMDSWRSLHELVDLLRDQVRETLPQVEQSIAALRDFETTYRRAMEEMVNQPPRFPVGVLLSDSWYQAGTRELSSLSQVHPRDLLCQIFRAWAPPPDLPAERRLSRFLTDVRDSTRRALVSSFKFADLYAFLEQNKNYGQAIAALPGAASPALIPTSDEKHPFPTPYEIIREEPRAFSVIGQPAKALIRGYIPSPDPDEIMVMRILHGMMAEAIPALREGYRRAYDRAGAEGMTLHIDRRWDSTMADLVHTSARREISQIWEALLVALAKKPDAIGVPMLSLARSLGVALDVIESAIIPGTPPDITLAVYKLRPFRLKLPPPTCAVLFCHSTRSIEELGEDIFRVITPLPLEEQFAFVVNVAGRRDIDQVVEPLRRVNYTVLVLDEADVKHLISARLPTRALGDLVLNKVSLTTVSPFYTRGPVPEHMFFGREREINEVRSKLRTHSVALIGGRRIGKTSTLQRLQRMLKPTESEYVPYYLDCHGATNYKSFFWLVCRRWEVEINQDAHPVEFEDVVTALQKRHPGKNIAILFDEVDSLLVFDREAENQETLFRTFRSLSNEKRCQYVFSGEKWLMRAIANPHSALFNFAQAVRLEPLPPKVVHHLVGDPFEMLNIWMEQSEQIIERIYQISAGHPNIVQMICQAMIEELDQDPQNANLLNFEHLDRATSRRTLQEEIVQTIWGQMSPLARMITLIWPEGTRYLSMAEIERLLKSVSIEHVPPERLERTAKDLELYCFVRPKDNDRLELIPMAFPAILDFMTDKKRQVDIVRRQYHADPQDMV